MGKHTPWRVECSTASLSGPVWYVTRTVNGKEELLSNIGFSTGLDADEAAKDANAREPVARMLIDDTVRFVLCEGVRERLGRGEFTLYVAPIDSTKEAA